MSSVLSTAWRIVVRQAISGRLILLGTHDSALIDLANRIVDLRDGEIAADTG